MISGETRMRAAPRSFRKVNESEKETAAAEETDLSSRLNFNRVQQRRVKKSPYKSALFFVLVLFACLDMKTTSVSFA